MAFKPQFDYYACEKAIVDGVPVYVKHVPWASRMQFRAMFRVGGRHDPMGKEGLAHFFEHLPFSGCAGWETELSIDEFSRRKLLGTLNASTFFDYTEFYAACLPRNAEGAMRFFGSLLFEPRLRQEDCEKQHSVIMQELWKKLKSEKNHDLRLKEKKAIYGSHPYGRMVRVLGKPETIPLISLDDANAHRKNHFHKQNLRLVFAGNITLKEAVSFSKIILEKAPDGVQMARPDPVNEWRRPECHTMRVSYGEHFGVRDRSALPKETNITFSRLFPWSPHYAVENTAASMITESWRRSLRVEFGDAYSVSESGYACADHDTISISTSVHPQAEGKALDALKTALEKIKQGEEEELFLETKQMLMDILEATDMKAGEIARTTVEDLSIRPEPASMAEVMSWRESVTHEQVCAFVQKQLSWDDIMLSIVTP